MCNGQIMEKQMAEEKKASVYQHSSPVISQLQGWWGGSIAKTDCGDDGGGRGEAVLVTLGWGPLPGNDTLGEETLEASICKDSQTPLPLPGTRHHACLCPASPPRPRQVGAGSPSRHRP